MSTASKSPETKQHDGHTVADDHGGLHPTERQYVMIGLILAAVTGVEVGLYYFNIGALNNVALLVLAAAKFAVVAMYFMHLKFDRPILRRLFVTGVVLAIGVYLAYLLMLGVFIDPVGRAGGGAP